MILTEQQFHDSVRELADQLYTIFPVYATYLGDHRADDKLGDFSREGVASQRAWLEQWLDRFAGADTTGWSVDNQIDCQMMAQLVRRALTGRLPFGYNNYDWLDRNPATYAYECAYGINALIVRPSPPAPVRLHNLISRLSHVPRVLAEGRALIDPVKVPPMWAGVALETARWASQMFGQQMPAFAETVPAEAKAPLLAAAGAATAALQEFSSWLEQTVLPQARGDFRLGKEEYTRILREEQMVEYDADELLAIGWQQYERIKREMEEAAAKIDPTRTPREILNEAKIRNHPTADSLFEDYRRTVNAARQFVIDHDLATIPEDDHLPVEWTPLFQEAFFFYAGSTGPALFEDVEPKFHVTHPGDDPEAAELVLRRHHYGIMPISVAHESYPGHHLQAVHARQGSFTRRLSSFLFTFTLGGWAWYCEDLYQRQGFASDPINTLSKLEIHFLGALWTIADVRLHSKEIDAEEAIAFFIENGVRPEYIRNALPMYSLLPTERHCDLLGKLQLTDLVADYQQQNPDATLREIHDAILSCGLIPPRMMRWLLLNETQANVAS